jgi:hypothetical protein
VTTDRESKGFLADDFGAKGIGLVKGLRLRRPLNEAWASLSCDD